MSRFHIQVVSNEEEFLALAEQWQVLAAQDNQATIFNDWQWNQLWWQHYKHLGELYVLLVFDNDLLVAIAPLYRNRSTALQVFKQHTLWFIGVGGDTSPDDLNMLCVPDKKEQANDAVWDHLLDAKFDRIMCTDLPAHSSFYKATLARLQAHSGYCGPTRLQSRRYAELPTQWSGFRQQISRNTHKQIKRRANRLASAGDVQFSRCETTEQVNLAFDALVQLHKKRWHAKGEGGAFKTDAYRQFHRAFMHELLAKKQLWLITLSIDGQIIGVEYAFSHKQTLCFFQTGFDPEFDSLSPGHVLMTQAIRLAIEAGLKRIDLLKGDYEYKASYANQEIQSASFTYYKAGVVATLASLKDKIKS